jgi:hypothetical protein
MRVPRKLKKAIKNTKMVLDLSIMPDGLDMDGWLHYWNNYGIALIDSSKRGKKPEVLGPLRGTVLKVRDIG